MKARNQVSKHAAEYKHPYRIQRKFFSYILETDCRRNNIQPPVNWAVRNLYVEICFENILYQKGNARKTSRQKASCVNKCIDINSHDYSCRGNQQKSINAFHKREPR